MLPSEETMELVFFAIVAVVLYITGKFADYIADQAAGTAFEQVHEVIAVNLLTRSSKITSRRRLSLSAPH